ncbi:MAG: gamma-glutamyltransferase [Gemmatimonadota bacterium]
MRLRLATCILFVLPSLAPAQDRPAVASRQGLVVSANTIASDIGAGVLARGGNAVDAAVATAFALAVTYPWAGNIGGGGFMIIQPARGEATTIDYRERAPGKSTPTMYLGADGEIDRSLTTSGYLAPGVPGTVRGLALAHRKYGKLPWRELVMPSVRLAERGFTIPASIAASLNQAVAGRMSQFPASIAAYGKPGGGTWAGGDTLRLPDLARTLKAIAEQGPDAFYTGWIADRIVDDMARHGGLITREDLAGYQPVERAPVKGNYRGHDIISMPPPSSGGVALIEMLNILEHFNLDQRQRYDATTVHLVIKAMRRAYLDRARWLGDPDFVEVPVARLTDKRYAATLAAGIDTTRATVSTALGADIVAAATAPEPEETTHFSVVDADGMTVSNTYTLEGGYGSYVVVEGAGFLLNNEMGDFNKKPGVTTTTGDIGTPANLIASGKRMLSSMTPTIVRKNGRTVLVTGSPGGRSIINTALAVVLGVTAFELDARHAVDAQRINHQWLPDQTSIEGGALTPEVLAALRAMGHDIREVARFGVGDAHSITIDPATGTAHGAADSRSSDSKASAPPPRARPPRLPQRPSAGSLRQTAAAACHQRCRY